MHVRNPIPQKMQIIPKIDPQDAAKTLHPHLQPYKHKAICQESFPNVLLAGVGVQALWCPKSEGEGEGQTESRVLKLVLQNERFPEYASLKPN